mgnify:CR=1 FL=1
MKRKRKQLVVLDGKRWLVDVPEDDVLYRLDCRAEYLRSRSLRLETSLDDVSAYIGGPPESQPEYIVEREDLHRQLANALSHLPAEERRLLYWRFEMELSQTEIARLMDCSQQKVSRELQRILLHLRRELQT